MSNKTSKTSGQSLGKVKCIIFDADFLIKSMENKSDIINFLDLNIGRPYKLIITGPVAYEIEMIGRNKGKGGIHARVAKIFIEKNGFEIVKTKSNYGDKSIIEVAQSVKDSCKTYVATSDERLMETLRKIGGIRIIRQKHMGKLELF